jgi:hypothetical protein
MVLLDRVKEGETREWYLRAALPTSREGSFVF